MNGEPRGGGARGGRGLVPEPHRLRPKSGFAGEVAGKERGRRPLAQFGAGARRAEAQPPQEVRRTSEVHR
jgi:hypothetical protein